MVGVNNMKHEHPFLSILIVAIIAIFGVPLWPLIILFVIVLIIGYIYTKITSFFKDFWNTIKW